MRTNTRMSDLLKEADIMMPLADLLPPDIVVSPCFTIADGSVLLKDAYEKAKHLKIASFDDRTGFECFVNHIHFPYDGSKESLQSCLRYATAIQKALSELGENRSFLVIVSISGVGPHGCAVRFHQCRPNEKWLADDLEGYGEEAILILPAQSTEITA